MISKSCLRFSHSVSQGSCALAVSHNNVGGIESWLSLCRDADYRPNLGSTTEFSDVNPTWLPVVNKGLAIFFGIVPDGIECDGCSLSRNAVERSLAWI